MSLSICEVSVDANGRELLEHGSSVFPIACYHDDLSKNEVPWHWHEELEAAIITEGCARVAAGNEKYTIHAGEGFFINSGILHGAWKIDARACRFHSLVFHARLVSGSTDSVFYQRYLSPLIHDLALESLFLTPTVTWQSKCLQAIESAWQACAQEPPGFEFFVRNALSEFAFQIYSNLTPQKQTLEQSAVRNHIRMKQMLQFIHDHYAQELSVAQIAKAASISSSECLRCFKHTISMTPIQYVRQYRLRRACQLLLADSHTAISEIAAACGFHDLSYFTKIFREAKGETPAAYRRAQTVSASSEK